MHPVIKTAGWVGTDDGTGCENGSAYLVAGTLRDERGISRRGGWTSNANKAY